VRLLTRLPVGVPFGLPSVCFYLQVSRQSVANDALADLDQSQLDQAIRPPISNALQLSAPDRADHLIQFGRGLGLALDMVMRIAFRVLDRTKEIGSFSERHLAHRATAVFDVEIARHVRWMRDVFRHGTPQVRQAENGAHFGVRSIELCFLNPKTCQH
jgi:hypothetical protein